MNCNDITIILDDRDLSELTANESRDVQIHLNACRECAAAFAAHRAVLEAAVPALPASLALRCRQIDTESPVRPARRASARPYIIGSMLLVGAAAAAVLSLQLSSESAPDPVAQASSAAMDGSNLPAAPSAGAELVNGGAEPIDAAVGILPEADAADPGPDSDAGQFTVAVAPLSQTASDPEAIRRSEMLYLAFAEALRKVPNLVLVELDGVRAGVLSFAAQTNAPAPADSSLLVVAPDGREVRLLDTRGLRPATVSSGSSSGNFNSIGVGVQGGEFEVPSALIGRIEAVTGDASATYGADAMAGVVNVILNDNIGNIQVDLNYAVSSEAAAVDLAHDFELDVAVGQSRDAGRFVVSGQSSSGQRLSTSLSFPLRGPADPAETVKPIIEQLQQNLFPPDAERLEAVRRRVVDPALTVNERLRALDDLKRFESRGSVGAVQNGVLLAVVDMAAGTVDGVQRASIWQSLQDVDNPILVSPLSGALLNDPSDIVRLESAKALAGLAEDASARAALALAAATDASAEVRMNARWASLDATGKRDYVIATLLDTGLADSERLAPLVFRPTWSDGGTADLAAVMDAGIARELTTLIRRSDNADIRATVLTQLGPVASESLATLYFDRLRDDPSDRVRTAAVIALRWRLDEPGVRFALEQAVANDPVASVRDAAARLLATRD